MGSTKGPLWKYTVRCKHVHLSGRRCAQRIPKKSASQMDCGIHKVKPCQECVSMAEAFGLNPQKVIS